MDAKGWIAAFAVVAALSVSAWLSSPEALSFSVNPAATPSPAPGISPSPAASPSASPSPAAFLDASFPATRATADGKTESVHVFVSNPRSESFKGKIRVVLRTVRGRALGPLPTIDCEIDPWEPARAVPIVIDLPRVDPEEYPLSGWLFLLATAAPEKAAPKLEIKAIAGPPDTGDWPLLRDAAIRSVICLALAGLISIAVRGIGVPFRRMGSPTWSFTDSWSSTLTVAGAMLTSLLAYTGLPDRGHHFSKPAYAILSLLLATLITLAPGIYNLFRKPVPETNPVRYQGLVLLFLVAGMVTMTGVLAQLQLLKSLFDDMARATVLSRATGDAFRTLCSALQVAMWVYALVSAVQAVLSQTAVKDEDGHEKVRQKAGEETPVAARPLPDWPLL